MFFFILAQVMGTAPNMFTSVPSPALPIAYVSVRGDSHNKGYLTPTWDPARPHGTSSCPKRGDKAWSETISFPAIVVRFDCPVGVAFKTWEPSGRRVHVGIKSTTTLHPGALPADNSVTYELVAPQ